MARPQWITEERLKDLNEAYPLVPAIRAGSHRDFRPPPTLESDFKRLLQHDVPHANYTFELVRDWYAAQEEGYEPVFIRAQQTPIDWKSKIGNSDMSLNFKTSHDVKIRKGDIVVREDGMIFMLNWNVTDHPNNQASQSVELNDYLTFTREHKLAVNAYGFAVDDDTGVELDEEGMEIIVKNMPCSHSEYAGRPDYELVQGNPGLSADHLLSCYVQWNEKTKGIMVNDQCKIGRYTYRVVNVYTGEVHIDKGNGVLSMNLRRVAGGGLVE